MHNPDHPFWILARQVVLLLCYFNKLSTADIIPIITIMLSVIGVDTAKEMLRGKQ